MQANFDTAVNYNVVRAGNISLQHPAANPCVLVEHSHPSPDELLEKLHAFSIKELLNQLFRVQACKEFHKTRKIEWLQEKDHDVTCLALSAAIGEDKQMIQLLNVRLKKLLKKKREKPLLTVIPQTNGETSYGFFDNGTT